MTGITTGPGWELRCGRWQDVLADVRGDALITDPPYSERTHRANGVLLPTMRRRLEYHPWNDADVMSFSLEWTRRVSGWIVVFSDSVLSVAFERYLSVPRYSFAPLPFVASGANVRLSGDGPSSWTNWIVVARPRHKPYSVWGTLPGAYILPPGQSEQGMFIGGKPLWVMRALVRDYSRPGDLIIDPCAGSGTTLLAAVIEGRRAIGAEMDPETYELAVERLRRGYTPALPLTAEADAEQLDLGAGEDSESETVE